jgi:hypothetical protein
MQPHLETGWAAFSVVEATVRRAVEHILEFHVKNRALASHYRTLQFSEESYFQTILANTSSLKLSNDSRRYTNWPAQRSAHPRTLTIDDLPAMLASNCHFARKFDLDCDAQVLDELDVAIAP